MNALPVRCSRCGCLSVAGLLIPSPFSLDGFKATAETVVGPAKCPLCQTVISDESTKLAEAIFAALHEAKLNRPELDALLNALMQSYRGKVSYPETVKAIEAAAPRAAGLKKFIPSGDVTGALGLIIAILGLPNDSVFDWAARILGQSGERKAEPSPPSRQPSRRVKLSSLTVHGKKVDADCYRYTLKGSWKGAEGDRLYHKVFLSGTRKIFREQVSAHPGIWHFPIRLWHPYFRPVGVFYIPIGRRRVGALDMELAQATAMLPFTFSIESDSWHIMKVKLVKVDEFITWYNTKWLRTQLTHKRYWIL